MLANSTSGSANTSRSPSPLRQLPALGEETNRNAYVTTPPAGAEFVGSAPHLQPTEKGIRNSSFLPDYFKRFFIEKRELGRGGRGVVLLVEHVLDGVSLGEFACKRIPVGNDHVWLEKVLVEVQLLQSLNHQNLVSYRHVWLEDTQPTNFGPLVPCIFILQQYCNAGDLHGYLFGSVHTTTKREELKERLRRRSKGQAEPPIDLNGPRRMQFDEIFSFFRDITSGLHHLHANGYIHRDLKPSNCLLHKSGTKLTVHVSDFGEVQAATARRNSTGATGTISYCAPEVLQRETPGGSFGNFSTKSDIFSLGMIVYFMCFGRLPYISADAMNDENEDIDQLRVEVLAWRGFDDATRTRNDLPERLYKFLRRLLSPNPLERPSTEQILLAIKGGGDIDPSSGHNADLRDVSSRVSAVDSPKAKATAHARKPSTDPSRPNLSQVGRHISRDLARSKSPPGQHDRSRETESGVVLRTRKVDVHAMASVVADPASPATRLILPPPRNWRLNATHALRHPMTVLGLRSIIFISKLSLLQYPCAPYAANAWFFYTLSLTALMDLLMQPSWIMSFALLGLHVLVVSSALHWGGLCRRTSLGWENL